MYRKHEINSRSFKGASLSTWQPIDTVQCRGICLFLAAASNKQGRCAADQYSFYDCMLRQTRQLILLWQLIPAILSAPPQTTTHKPTHVPMRCQRLLALCFPFVTPHCHCLQPCTSSCSQARPRNLELHKQHHSNVYHDAIARRDDTLLQMLRNDGALRDAPPTRKPSMSGCVASSLQLPSVTEPP